MQNGGPGTPLFNLFSAAEYTGTHRRAAMAADPNRPRAAALKQLMSPDGRDYPESWRPPRIGRRIALSCDCAIALSRPG